MQDTGKCALVVGATGGVGQVLTGKLLEVSAARNLLLGLASGDRLILFHMLLLPVQRGYKVKALSRSSEKARSLFGDAQNLEVMIPDLSVLAPMYRLRHLLSNFP